MNEFKINSANIVTGKGVREGVNVAKLSFCLIWAKSFVYCGWKIE